MEKESFAIENFRNIQALIVFVHNKAGAILVIYGFILSAFISFAKDLDFIRISDVETDLDKSMAVLLILTGFALIVILIVQMYVIIFGIIKPQMAASYPKGERSLFYFEHIASMEKSLFAKQFNDLPQEQILNEILSQVYEIAIILNGKMNKLSKSIGYLFASILLLLTFILLSKLM